MIDTIQNAILQIHDFIDSSLNPGTSFLVFFGAIVFSCYMLCHIHLRRDLGKKLRLEKMILVLALALCAVFVLDIIIAGDLYPNLSAEKMARVFAEDLCAGTVQGITEDKNRDLAPTYYDSFVSEWAQESNELADIRCEADDFIVLEYRYERGNIFDAESYTVILQALKILSIPENVNEIKQCDFDLHISLTRIAIPSRFLGKYMRWRVNGFSYAKSEPYTTREWLDSIQKELVREWLDSIKKG